MAHNKNNKIVNFRQLSSIIMYKYLYTRIIISLTKCKYYNIKGRGVGDLEVD